jgi:carboxyl-terminal processing protease
MPTFIVKNTISVFVALVLFLSGCATNPKMVPAETIASNTPKTCPPHLQKLCTAYTTVQNHYIKQIPDDRLTDIFIRGAIKELGEEFQDPYSKYTSLEDLKAEAINDEKYAGTGMNIKKDTRAPYAIKVQGVFRGTPASKAGIQRGDTITHIEGIPIGDKTVEESRDLIRGKIGTPVTLTISRYCERPPFPVTIKRESIEDVVSGIVRMITPHYAYVYIPSFEAEKNIALRVKYSLRKIQELYGKPRGLIIDFRNNPGGNVAHAENFVSLFVEKGDVLYHLPQHGKEYAWSIPENSRDILFGAPIVALVNEDSKSAAEITAGALQDLKRAIILGTKTFGKGVMQTTYTLADKSELHITTAYTLTPHHTFIDKAGITPDIIVEEGSDESCTGDHQLEAALNLLRSINSGRAVIAQK